MFNFTHPSTTTVSPPPPSQQQQTTDPFTLMQPNKFIYQSQKNPNVTFYRHQLKCQSDQTDNIIIHLAINTSNPMLVRIYNYLNLTENQINELRTLNIPKIDIKNADFVYVMNTYY